MKIRLALASSDPTYRSLRSDESTLVDRARARRRRVPEGTRRPKQPKGPALESEVAKASYGLGYNIAGNVDNQYGKALDSKAFQVGIEDGFAGAKAKVPEDQVLAALNALNDARAEERTANSPKRISQPRRRTSRRTARRTAW